jgi:hypothetical protein
VSSNFRVWSSELGFGSYVTIFRVGSSRGEGGESCCDVYRHARTRTDSNRVSLHHDAMASPSEFRRLAASIWCRKIGCVRGIRTVAASFLVVTREPSSSAQTGNEDFASKILSEMRGRREEEVRGRTNQCDPFHSVVLTSFCCYLSSPIALFLFIRVSGTMCLNFSDFQCEENIDRVVCFPGCSGSSLHPTEILAHGPTAEVATSLS